MECCPGLIEFALKWYFGPVDKLGPDSKARITNFISQHQAAATLVFSTYGLRWKIDGEADVAVDSLKEIASAVGPWLSSMVDDC